MEYERVDAVQGSTNGRLSGVVIARLRARWYGRPSFLPGKALFDPEHYRAAHPEVVRAGQDPFAHFMSRGWKEGRNPHPLFDTAWYLATNEDVRDAGTNPLMHFALSGWREGRDPHPLFSLSWYLERNPEVARSGVNPLLHFMETGAGEGRDPHPDFDAAAYLAGLADPAVARGNPLLHHLATAERKPQTLPPSRRVPKPARKAAAHFRHVVELAARDELIHPLDLGEFGPVPVVSFVVPVFNTKPGYLDDLLASFRRQPAPASELILSDDGSTAGRTRAWLSRHAAEPGVRVVWNGANRGIAAATNAGVTVTRGTWVALLDHDDALAPFAVHRIVRALRRRPDCLFLYTDEVVADRKLRPAAYFLKPAWDPVLLSGVNYVNHLSLYRKDRLLAVGGLRDGYQGSQDYDLLLRYTAGLAVHAIVHLPYPAYLWRRDGASYSARFLAASTASARRALGERFRQDGCDPVVDPAPLLPDLHRVRFDGNRKTWPRVSVVIPSRDGLRLIARVLDGLLERTDYPDLDVIVVDNGTTDPEVLALYERHRGGPVPFRTLIRAEAFNFSRAVNRGVAAATGDLVLLLNNDVEVESPGWLKEMVSCFDYPDTGVVGAKLLYPDRTLQHVGVIAGLSGLAGHWFIGRGERFPGPMGRLAVRQSMSVVTAACMLVSKRCFDVVGPFDADVFPIAYNDVDFCLRAVAQRFRVVLTPFATLIHHESATRGSDETPENIARFNRDKASLAARHGTGDMEDPAFNPWLSKHHADFPPVLLDHLPDER